MEWIPIAERLPVHHSAVLARVVGGSTKSGGCANAPYTIREVIYSPLLSAWIEFTTSDSPDEPLHVTHWRELSGV